MLFTMMALFLTAYTHDCIFWPVGLQYIFYMIHIYNLVGLPNDKRTYKMTLYDPGGNSFLLESTTILLKKMYSNNPWPFLKPCRITQQQSYKMTSYDPGGNKFLSGSICWGVLGIQTIKYIAINLKNKQTRQNKRRPNR